MLACVSTPINGGLVQQIASSARALSDLDAVRDQLGTSLRTSWPVAAADDATAALAGLRVMGGVLR